MRSTGPDLPDGPLTLHFDPDGPLLDATIACEQQVFKERYDVVAADLAEYYRPVRRRLVLPRHRGREGEVLGMSRVVFPGPASLVTLVDIAGRPRGRSTRSRAWTGPGSMPTTSSTSPPSRVRGRGAAVAASARPRRSTTA